MNALPKISAVMCTYNRFKCVERAMNCFLAQDYQGEKELIIFNTNLNDPYFKLGDFSAKAGNNITIINKNLDNTTWFEYTNVGAIRRDALQYATGDFYVCWDDDDIFLPWMFRQSIDRMQQTGLPSFKPKMSFFYSGGYLRLVQNTLEASIVSDIKKIREYGFLLETGSEGLGWYVKMRDNKELDENDSEYLPHYCFNWNDGAEMSAGHKQSGDIDNPDNFNNHKQASNDPVKGRMLEVWDKSRMDNLFHVYYDYILTNQSYEFDKSKIKTYLLPNL
jgi:glycosyltransferase involved in cell wall biosynthesis